MTRGDAVRCDDGRVYTFCERDPRRGHVTVTDADHKYRTFTAERIAPVCSACRARHEARRPLPRRCAECQAVRESRA